jgi:hypothetical protein
MQMSVPKIKAQVLVISWKRQAIVPEFVMDGVPYTVRHFHGLWAVGSLIGSTMDVDLVSESQGSVRILIAMRDLSALEKDLDGSNQPCLEDVALLKLNGYRLQYRREAAGYVPDPRFRPFFWKEDDDDEDSHGMDDKPGDPSPSAAPNTANMDVDAHPPSGDSGKKTTPSVGAKVALTPFNHSPVTPRGGGGGPPPPPPPGALLLHVLLCKE